MYYTSANRDEHVFDDPQRFDIHREPNPHLSFGIGEHFCLGVHLARLEGRVFFEELLRPFPTIELAGDPVRSGRTSTTASRSCRCASAATDRASWVAAIHHFALGRACKPRGGLR